MLMELAYRLATETSPLINQIRDNVYVSVTPVADPDGRDRNVDWFYRNRELGLSALAPAGAARPRPAGARRLAARRRRPAGRRWRPRRRAGRAVLGSNVFHDNNRDINLSQVSMRAITDWYFTAHPPIMHDLHESQPLLYTYSGAAPQNPNLDPILFAELPFFSNFELSQMTKWGMPGVYTHAFMDGWSPGYLGSVAYNHNGMMRMRETQAGNDIAAAAPAPRKAGRRRPSHSATPSGPPRRLRSASVAAGRGQQRRSGTRGRSRTRRTRPRRGGGGRQGARAAEGDQGRRRGPWRRDAERRPLARRRDAAAASARVVSRTADSAGRARQLVAAQQRQLHADRRPVGPATHGHVPEPGGRELLPEDPELNRVGKDGSAVRVRHSGAARSDARRRARQHPPGAGIEVGRASGEIKISDGTFPAGSYVIKRDQPYGRLAKNLLERQSYPDPSLAPTTTAAGRWAWRCSPTSARSRTRRSWTQRRSSASVEGKVTVRDRRGWRWPTTANNMVAFRYKLRNVPMKITDRATTIDGVEVPAGSFVAIRPPTSAPSGPPCSSSASQPSH